MPRTGVLGWREHAISRSSQLGGKGHTHTHNTHTTHTWSRMGKICPWKLSGGRKKRTRRTGVAGGKILCYTTEHEMQFRAVRLPRPWDVCSRVSKSGPSGWEKCHHCMSWDDSDYVCIWGRSDRAGDEGLASKTRAESAEAIGRHAKPHERAVGGSARKVVP